MYKNLPNLGDIIFEYIDYAGHRLVFNPPLTLSPRVEAEHVDEDCVERIISVSDEYFKLYLFEGNIPNLIDLVKADFDVMWHDYALADDEELTPDAVDLKHKLLARITCENTGPGVSESYNIDS